MQRLLSKCFRVFFNSNLAILVISVVVPPKMSLIDQYNSALKENIKQTIGFGTFSDCTICKLYSGVNLFMVSLQNVLITNQLLSGNFIVTRNNMAILKSKPLSIEHSYQM